MSLLDSYMSELAATILTVDTLQVEKAALMLSETRKRSSFVWLVGNGGSAATCSHFANDLIKMCKIRAIALPDLVPGMLAYGNDEGWENMFWGLVGEYARTGDVLVAISCSGRSANIVKAAKHCSENNLIVLTGRVDKENILVQSGARVVIGVETNDIKLQEDAHLAVCHSIINYLTA